MKNFDHLLPYISETIFYQILSDLLDFIQILSYFIIFFMFWISFYDKNTKKNLKNVYLRPKNLYLKTKFNIGNFIKFDRFHQNSIIFYYILL